MKVVFDETTEWLRVAVKSDFDWVKDFDVTHRASVTDYRSRSIIYSQL